MWRSNPKTWVARKFFVEWVNLVFGPTVKKYLQENNLPVQALLILDNAPAHPPNLEDDILEDDGEHKPHPLREFWKDHFNIAICLQIIDQAWLGVTTRTLTSAWKKLWPEAVAERIYEELEPGVSVEEEIVSMGKSMGLEVEERDVNELIEEHTQELTTEEIQELQSQQHTEVMQVIGFEESEEEVISTREIKEILGMWEKVSHTSCHNPLPTMVIMAWYYMCRPVVYLHPRSNMATQTSRSISRSFFSHLAKGMMHSPGTERPFGLALRARLYGLAPWGRPISPQASTRASWAGCCPLIWTWLNPSYAPIGPPPPPFGPGTLSSQYSLNLPTNQGPLRFEVDTGNRAKVGVECAAVVSCPPRRTGLSVPSAATGPSSPPTSLATSAPTPGRNPSPAPSVITRLPSPPTWAATYGSTRGMTWTAGRPACPHLIVHTDSGEKYFSCPHCDFKTDQASHIEAHLHTHAGEKIYACPFCPYSTAKSSHLTRHVRTHTGEKPYSCSHCNYRTASSSNLATHTRTHTGEKPFSCPDCHYKTSKSSLLARHKHSHTEPLHLSCPACNYKTRVISHLAMHICTHSQDRPYS
ncbi:hypothetical protein LAZ67_12001808 [Cordylochernes scorpioides]|uniref:C2H2-type domain-containing protein n=1 Tax=Cordylochernes scorpioides TaxID=51811 RepID=A0ABY6L1A0_9ARAC|nr:hypothetical protein LAZ67_12001808 [Cordylochernes scorpioides]